MGRHFESGMLAGVTAAVIWIAISLMVGMDMVMLGVWALIMLVGVAAITMIISNVRDKGARRVERA